MNREHEKARSSMYMSLTDEQLLSGDTGESPDKSE
jgi:hypothetical protein